MYLALDDAAVDRRAAITEDEDPSAAGPEPRRVTHDRVADAAYLYLADIRPRGVADTVAFSSDETRPAWGINLDFDHDDRLVGIEFESARMAPQALLARAERPGH